MFNLFCLGLFVWGVFEIVSGIRILLHIPLILLARLFAKPVQIGYTKKELDELYRRSAANKKTDSDGIPYL
jgi:hypothetical protein